METATFEWAAVVPGTDVDSAFAPDFSPLRSTVHDTYEEYGRFQQHLVLLEDTVRLGHYHHAIAQARPGGVVVDVGAGTGILSLMALRAGFEQAYLIEPSRKIATYARYMLERNKVGGRFHIIQKPLERVTTADLPPQIDLIVTETISSVITGFGSWDTISILTARLSPTGTMIPSSGRLFGFLAERDYATRSNRNGGLRFLKKHNIEVDLFFRAFRSGGNVFDKNRVNYELASGMHQVFEVLTFDYKRQPCFDLSSTTVAADTDKTYLGLTVYWELALGEGTPAINFTSRDPNLTAWYPYYIPFSQPIVLKAGQPIRPTIRPLPIDAPYVYAFQIVDGLSEQPLSHVLYW